MDARFPYLSGQSEPPPLQILFPLAITHALNEVKLIYSNWKFSAVLPAKNKKKECV